MNQSNEQTTLYLQQLKQKWRTEWPDNIPQELVYPLGDIPICDYLQNWAKQQPNKIAVHYYGHETSYGELDRQSNQFAHYLYSIGVKAGDPVAVFMPNCPQFLIAFMGILKMGGIYHPVSPLSKEMELQHQLSDCKPKAVVSFDQLLPVLQPVCKALEIEYILATSLSEICPENPSLPVPDLLQMPKVDLPAGVVDFYSSLQPMPDTPVNHQATLTDIAAVNYTGGTTGLPKGCIHTHEHMIYTCASYMPTLIGKQNPDLVTINFLPQFWIAGENSSLLFPIFSGSTQVLLCRWDCLTYMSAVQHYNVQLGTLLVDSVDEVLNHAQVNEFDLKSLEITPCVSFIKKLTHDYRQRWQELTGCVLFESSYGMTETNTCDTFTAGFQKDDFDLSFSPSFVGLPVSGTEFKVCDFDTGELLPLGCDGELCIRTPSLFSGYWNKPELNEQAFDNGWFHTGDLGVIDERGYIRYLGRRKEMIKVNGMSVFPTELETMLGRHSAILASAVIPREDPQTGQKPVAFIVLRANSDETSDSLMTWCKDAMAIYKVPEIRFVESLPMTATGKVKKNDLQDWL